MLKPEPTGPSRTVITLVPTSTWRIQSPAVAISPMALGLCREPRDGPAQLFLRPLNALKAEPVLGTEGASAPFFARWAWLAFSPSAS
jgi:hypothetical protein